MNLSTNTTSLSTSATSILSGVVPLQLTSTGSGSAAASTLATIAAVTLMRNGGRGNVSIAISPPIQTGGSNHFSVKLSVIYKSHMH